jgi:hypothetical protein
MENVTGKDEISLGSLYSGLLATKVRLELQSSQQYQSSVNSAACGRGGYHGGGRQGEGGGRRQGKGGGRGSFGHGFGGHGDHGSSSGTKLMCQLCKKTGHTVL